MLERQHESDPWTHTGRAQDGSPRMPEIGIEIPVAEIFQNITFPDQPDSPV